MCAWPGQMPASPLPERLEHRAERPSIRRDAVAYAAPRRPWLSTLDEPVGSHLSQLLAQHFRRHARHRATELREASRRLEQALIDHRLPAAVDDADRGVQRTSGAFGVAVFLFRCVRHGGGGYFKVPNCVIAGRGVESPAMVRLFRVIVPVADIDRAADFYGTLLAQAGFRVSPGRHYFDCGGVVLACFSPRADGDEWDATPNPDHLYFAVDDLDALYARAERLGGLSAETGDGNLPMGKIARRPWGERSFYLRDPFGNKLCFVDEATVFRGPPASS